MMDGQVRCDMLRPMSDSLTHRAPAARADGMGARILLAFLGTAGLFYVNIMPALVQGLIDGLGFSNREAGLVTSANVYGAALGALLAVPLVRRLNWRATALAMLIGLMAIDAGSMVLSEVNTLIGVRFIHGVVGGFLVGTAFSVMARTADPDVTFGVLLFVQFGIGGLGVMFLPGLVPVYGIWVLFASLMAFSAVTLVMLPFMPPYPLQDPRRDLQSAKGGSGPKMSLPLVLALIALFLFQAANMGLYAYIIGLGKWAHLELGFITPTLLASAWIGLAGAGLVIVLSTRFGRTVPLAIALLVTVVANWALHFSAVEWIFLVANCGVGVTWAFVVPYYLGMCAALDRSGQLAALAGFVSKLGLASGPLAAGLLLGEDNYPLMINIAVIALILGFAVTLLPARALDRTA
jgi:predicted MFS family arabinose efflux permease